MITFTGPTEVTRDGETYTEWSVDGFDDCPSLSLRASAGLVRVTDEGSGESILVLLSELGPVAAMLADAQQHLTGGQR